MKAMRLWARRLWYFLNRRKLEGELDREMASHRAMMDDPRRFGNIARLREKNADVWGWTWVDGVSQDLRYAVRLLFRSPAFTLTAISTLALGIGASTAIFSVAYGVSLRPLPYSEPERLIRVFEANPAEGLLKQNVSEFAFQAWRDGAPSLQAVALYTDVRPRFLADSNQPINVMYASPILFDMLGIRPSFGQGFKSEREYGRGTNEAILSYGAWQRLFGGRRDLIGEPVTLKGSREDDVAVVVGVMPEHFGFGPPTDMWSPHLQSPSVPPIARAWRYDHVVGKLRDGATIEQARAELEAVATRLDSDFPASNKGWTVTVEPLRASIIGNFGHATWLLLAAVATVLLVSCVNVAGLLLARAVARERETAVRQALGAPRSRLARLWLAESLMLATLGAGFGLLFAWSGIAILKAAAPPGIPRLDAIVLDLPVLGMAAVSAVIAVLVITVVPLGTDSSFKQHLVKSLHAASAVAGEAKRQRFMREALILAQCAGAVVLVVLAVLLTRSFTRLSSFDLGWDSAGVLSLKVQPPLQSAPRIPAYWFVDWSDRLTAQLASTPGIENAAITTSIPLTPQGFPVVIGRGRGKSANDDVRGSGVLHSVTDGYFEMMGISLIGGRIFAPEDRLNEELLTSGKRSLEPGVAVVSQRLAQTFWPGRSPLGETLWLPDLGDGPWREVVGVVEDIQFHAVGEEPALNVFVPYTQRPTYNPFLLVKGSGTGASIAGVVRRVVEEVEPGTGIDQVAALDALVSRATAQPRFTTQTVATFGLLALGLAAIGIYGTLSYLVESRRREIAIRVSLGASRNIIVPHVLGRAFWPVIAGSLIGLLLAAALAQMFESLLFQVEPLDIPSFIAGATLLLGAALAAALGPAVRVLRVNLNTVLRSE